MMKSDEIKNFLLSRFAFLLVAVVCFVVASFISGERKQSFNSSVRNFENDLREKEKHAIVELNRLSEKTKKWSYNEMFSEKTDYYESLFEREGLVFLVFESDSLRFWTDNTVAVGSILSQNNFKDKIVKLPDGWFEVEKLSSGKNEMFALILLKREYAYENKYLTNEFQGDFNLSAEVGIKIDAEKIGKIPKFISEASWTGAVFEREGDYLLTLVAAPGGSENPFVFFWVIIF